MTFSHGRLTASLVTGVLGLSLLTIASPATATSEPDPLWYYNVLGYEGIHDSGVTGEGVTIAVLDSPINLEIPTLQGADIRVQPSVCVDENGVPRPSTSTDVDVAQHGTNIVSYLVGTGAGYDGQTGVKGVAPGATVLYFPLHDPETTDCYVGTGADPLEGSVTREFGLAMQAAVAAGPDIISVSVSGVGTDLMLDVMSDAVRKGIVVVAGLGNSDGESEDGAPATLNGAVSVLGAQSNGELNLGVGGPNTSEYVLVVGPGWEILSQGNEGNWANQRVRSGSSIATPIVAGTLALAFHKYPDATGNQILQSMIHNTGTVSGEPVWDPTFGYGFVVPTTLLAADPTQYPDANPLLIELSGDDVLIDEKTHNDLGQPWRAPFVEDIFPEGVPPTVAPTDNPSATPSPSSEGASGGSLGTIALVGGIAVLALLVIIVIVIAVTRKKTT